MKCEYKKCQTDELRTMDCNVTVCFCKSLDEAQRIQTRQTETTRSRQDTEVAEDMSFGTPMYCSNIAVHNVDIATGIFSYEDVFAIISDVIIYFEGSPSRLDGTPEIEDLVVWSAILREMDPDDYVIVRNN